ncbi:MAG TPA: hypothetical protein VLN42_01425 [Casimicrobiaceae bacterium]|nr:hypothetical protein [Casimicrobiaceae bacterium]
MSAAATKLAGALLAALLLAPFAPLAHAGPDDYVHVPAVEYGEREIELRFGTASATDEHRQSAASLAFGYGVTPWWFTEVYGKWHRSGATSFDAFEWENRFQLTEPGQYFADFGLLVEIERPRDHAEGYELRLGPLMQKDVGPVQANVNVLIERHYRATEPEVTELGYQWQLRYRFRPAFDFGAQGFGEVGAWNDWAPAREQEHIAGPAIFGKLSLGGRQALQYNAAVLFKLSHAAPATTVRAQLEYEF